jgi:hypothetical protein
MMSRSLRSRTGISKRADRYLRRLVQQGRRNEEAAQEYMNATASRDNQILYSVKEPSRAGAGSARLIWGALLRHRNDWASWALAFSLFVLSVSSHSWCWAQAPSRAGNSAVDDEPLSEKVTDPLAYLTQIQIKDIYTPAEYGTNAQPNTVQIRSIFSSSFWLIPFEQLIRPTMKVESTPDAKGASTTTAYDDMQLLDLFVMPWPNSQDTHFRWGLGPYFIFPTSTSNLLGQGLGKWDPPWVSRIVEFKG